MNDIFEKNHPMKDDKKFITSYWSDRARDFGSLRAKELDSPKLKFSASITEKVASESKDWANCFASSIILGVMSIPCTV